MVSTVQMFEIDCGSPVVTNPGSWTTSADCKRAAETAFIADDKRYGNDRAISETSG
jgi:hypothetical protein